MANDVIKVKYEADVSQMQKALKQIIDANVETSESFDKVVKKAKDASDKTQKIIKSEIKALQDLKEAREDANDVGSAAYNKQLEETIKKTKEAKEAAQGYENTLSNIRKVTSDDSSNKKLKDRLEEITAKLYELSKANQEGTSEFILLQNQAVELTQVIAEVDKEIETLSSTTANLDGLVEIGKGINAAFEIAKDSLTLTGEKNEELEQAIQKLTIAQNILNNAQEIGEVVQKGSAATTTAHAVASRVLATSNTITSATFRALGISAGTASIGFRVLSAAIIATGIGAIAVGVGLLISNFDALASSFKSFIGINDNGKKAADALNKSYEEQNKLIEKQIEKRKYESDIRSKEIDLIENDEERARAKAAQRHLDTLAEISERMEAKRRERNLDLEIFILTTKDEKAKVAARNLINANDKEINQAIAKEKSLSLGKYNQDVEKINADAAKKASDKQKEANEKSIKADFDYREKQIANMEEGVTKELATEKLRYDKLVQENKGDKKLLEEITKEHETKVQNILNESYEKQLNDSKQAAKKSVDDSLKTLDAETAHKIAEQQLIINNANSSVEEKEKAEKAINDIENEAFANRKNLLDDQLESGLISQKQYNEELIKLSDDAAARQLDYDNKVTEKKKQNMEEVTAFLADQNKTQEQKELAAIDDKYKALYEKAVGNEEQLSELKEAHTKERNDYQNKKDEEASKENRDFAIDQAKVVADAAFEILNNARKAKTDAQLSDLDKQKEAELSNTNLTQAEKDAVNKKYDEKAKAIKLKAWKADKEASLTQAIINGALAVVKALPVIPLAVAAGIAAAAQIAVIASQKPPKFARGVIDLDGPGTATSDSIPARLSRGESVMTARETQRYREELMAIRGDNFGDLIYNKYVLPELKRSVEEQAGFATNLVRALALQRDGFDDSRIVSGLRDIRPATGKDIAALGDKFENAMKEAEFVRKRMYS